MHISQKSCNRQKILYQIFGFHCSIVLCALRQERLVRVQVFIYFILCLTRSGGDYWSLGSRIPGEYFPVVTENFQPVRGQSVSKKERSTSLLNSNYTVRQLNRKRTAPSCSASHEQTNCLLLYFSLPLVRISFSRSVLGTACTHKPISGT